MSKYTHERGWKKDSPNADQRERLACQDKKISEKSQK